MIYYEPIKVMINRTDLAEVIFDVVVHHYGILELIILDQGLLFISKFLSSLCYFLGIKKMLSTAFHPQTNSQTKR